MKHPGGFLGLPIVAAVALGRSLSCSCAVFCVLCNVCCAVCCVVRRCQPQDCCELGVLAQLRWQPGAAAAARQDTGLRQCPPATCIRIPSGGLLLFLDDEQSTFLFTVGLPSRDHLISASSAYVQGSGQMPAPEHFLWHGHGYPLTCFAKGGTRVAAACFRAALAAAHGQAFRASSERCEGGSCIPRHGSTACCRILSLIWSCLRASMWQ